MQASGEVERTAALLALDREEARDEGACITGCAGWEEPEFTASDYLVRSWTGQHQGEGLLKPLPCTAGVGNLDVVPACRTGVVRAAQARLRIRRAAHCVPSW